MVKLENHVAPDLCQIPKYTQTIYQDEAAHQHFRFRNLPLELQAHIIRLCLPEWSFDLTRIKCARCRKWDRPRYGYRKTPKSRQPSTKDLRTLRLVDHRMEGLVQSELSCTFSGCLHMSFDFERLEDFPRYCTCEHLRRSGGRALSTTQPELKNITSLIIFLRARNFGFDSLNWLVWDKLPNLRVAIAQAEPMLFDAEAYESGQEKFLTKMLADEKLLKLVTSVFRQWTARSSFRLMVQRMWAAGIRTVVEMKIGITDGALRFEFMCVFLVREADPVVLGRWTMHDWEKSSGRRGAVYDEAYHF